MELFGKNVLIVLLYLPLIVAKLAHTSMSWSLRQSPDADTGLLTSSSTPWHSTLLEPDPVLVVIVCSIWSRPEPLLDGSEVLTS